MIVLDTSTLVSATFRPDNIPARAVDRAMRDDLVAISDELMAELLDVLHRPSLARFTDPVLRAGLLDKLAALGVPFAPTERITNCRDPDDDKVLELALASAAPTIVSSDADLLVLHPWRGVRILRPADYLAAR